MKTLQRRLVSALAVVLFLSATAAWAQISPAEMAALKERAQKEKWTFTVGENPATMRPLSALTGLLAKPRNWRTGAKSAPVKPRTALPASFDWRALGGCTPVRDQGYCGSCWAFGTIGPLESAILINDGIAVDLSEQWLVSCNQSGWSCMGGFEAFDYLLASGGLTDPCGGSGAVLEEDFPYAASDLTCNCPYDHPFAIAEWAYIDSVNDIPAVNDIKQAIMTYGPVSAAMTVDYAFQAYTGGVFGGAGCVSGMVNHQIVLVGWDDNMGTNGVWILRNSWGEGWGEGGYMYIEYGCSDAGYAACYIEYEAGDVLQVAPFSGTTSTGDVGGPFSPLSEQYTLTNNGTSPVNWQVTNAEPWVTLFSPVSGMLGPGQSVQVTVTINSGANSLPSGVYTDPVTFTNTTSGRSAIRIVRLTIIPPAFYEEPLDANPMWTAAPGWAFGAPTGSCSDPDSAHTGANVYGFNLSGCYQNEMLERTLTTRPLNCLGYNGVMLEFWRWLNVESVFWDRALVRVSNDGANWTTVWANPSIDLLDAAWTRCRYDLSAVADNEETVYVQWVMGPADYTIALGGWNIDDIRLLGERIDDLIVTPNDTLKSSGYEGGPFNPGRLFYTLTNNGAASLDWNAEKRATWLTLIPASGSLDPGASTQVAIAVNSSATGLTAGTYEDTLTVTNKTSGVSQTRAVTLKVQGELGADELFTEHFDSVANDLSYKTLTLMPDGSPAMYAACLTAADAFPTDPAGATTLTLDDDAYAAVNLAGGYSVKLYGTAYPRFYVGSNGNITFGSGDTQYWPDLINHFNRPRISGFFDDLLPAAGGRISWRQLDDRAVVTFEDVPEWSFYSSGPPVSFQVEMFFDGVLRITWLRVAAPFGIAGLSKGLGVPPGFVESDLSETISCDVEDETFSFISYPKGGWYEENSPLHFEVTTANTFGEVTYQWKLNGQPLDGETNRVLHIPALILDEHTGFYTCAVSDQWAKSTLESPPAYVRVYPLGGLPAFGAATLIALLLSLIAAAVTHLGPDPLSSGQPRGRRLPEDI